MRPYEIVSHQRSADTFDWAASKELNVPPVFPPLISARPSMVSTSALTDSRPPSPNSEV